MLKAGLNRPLMREILDKLNECKGRLSELLIDSGTDESEVNSAIKGARQEGRPQQTFDARDPRRIE